MNITSINCLFHPLSKVDAITAKDILIILISSQMTPHISNLKNIDTLSLFVLGNMNFIEKLWKL